MKISIALCTYNGEKFISEQLQSLFSQTQVPDEIIVSDDGSKDKTIDIAEKLLKASKIPYKLFKQTPSLGVYKNFEFCMSQCTHDIIFPCDQDDIWKKDKLEKHLRQHESHIDKVLVYSNADVIQNDVDHYLYPLWDPKLIENGQYHTKNKMLYEGKSIAGCCMSIDREFFHQILPIPHEIYHDDWCATSASLIDGILGIPESLIYYRQHGGNVVGTIRGNKLSYWKSLFTNVPFYVNSDRYILSRNQKVFKALLNHNYLKQLVKKETLQQVLDYYEIRTDYKNKSLTVDIKDLTQLLKRGDYKYHHGIFSYLKDIYNCLFVKYIKG